MRGDAEPLQNLVGMVGRAVGQDQLASGELCGRGGHGGVRCEHGWCYIDFSGHSCLTSRLCLCVPAFAATMTYHGIAKRSVLPPLLMSTAAKPVIARPRVPQSPCSLISNLLSRVQSWVAPPQFSGLSLNLTARFSASTASAKLKICLGWPTTSGCRHLPGSMRYQPRLITVLPSSVPTAAMRSEERRVGKE